MNNDKPFTIRDAQPTDVFAIHTLISKLAEYEKLSDEVVSSPTDLDDWLFGDEAFVGGLIADIEGDVVGFALYFPTYSTFVGRPGLYLEDLFVEQDHRGQGIGKAILTRLAEIAVERNYGRVEWSVLNWNEPAIGFYKSIGAKFMDEWTINRLDGDALQRLGAAADED